jgi:hypothetical protein
MAEREGFTPETLLTAQATYDAVVGGIRAAARELSSGDIFFVTYSGHGGQVPDLNGEELDGRDETWVLFDRMIVDDELYGLWSEFKPGTRIVVLSDSCHSGTVMREAASPPAVRSVFEASLHRPLLGGNWEDHGSVPTFKVIPDEVGGRHYRDNQGLYDSVQVQYRSSEKADLAATVMLISGCADNQTSADGPVHGLFTEKLLRTLEGSPVTGGYRGLHRRIVKQMPMLQTPQYSCVPANPAFEGQRPFSIDGRQAASVKPANDDLGRLVALLEELIRRPLDGQRDWIAAVPAVVQLVQAVSGGRSATNGRDLLTIIPIATQAFQALGGGRSANADRDWITAIPAVVQLVQTMTAQKEAPGEKDLLAVIPIAIQAFQALGGGRSANADRDWITAIPAVVQLVQTVTGQRGAAGENDLLTVIPIAIQAFQALSGGQSSDRDWVSAIPAVVQLVQMVTGQRGAPDGRDLFTILPIALQAIQAVTRERANGGVGPFSKTAFPFGPPPFWSPVWHAAH